MWQDPWRLKCATLMEQKEAHQEDREGLGGAVDSVLNYESAGLGLKLGLVGKGKVGSTRDIAVLAPWPGWLAFCLHSSLSFFHAGA